MDLMFKGGPIMYFLLGCSITVIYVFINKIIHLHRARIDIHEYMPGLKNAISSGRITEAITLCEHTPGPVAGVLKAGVMNHGRDIAFIKETMEKASLKEIPRMEQSINVLNNIAIVSPLIGLLGTVFGFIKIFQVMSQNAGLITQAALAGGIWEALLTTAFGLCVAILSYLAYNNLYSRVNILVQDMENGATELVVILSEERLG